MTQKIPAPPSGRRRRETPAQLHLREMERLTHPVYQQRAIDKWKLIAGACCALVAGGFSAAVWLQMHFASQADISRVVTDQDKTNKNVEIMAHNMNKLTVNVAKLTTVAVAQGKMQDEVRMDIREMREEARVPLQQRPALVRRQRRARTTPASFNDVLKEVKLDMAPLEETGD